MLLREITRVLDVLPVRQISDFDCGPAAVRSVLGYYGIEMTERDVIKATHTSKKWGAEPEDMAKFLVDKGLEVFDTNDMTVDDLRLCTQNGAPVIVVIQAWGDRDDYSNDDEDSHYVVVKGVGENVVKIEDPSTDTQSEMPIDEFVKRWRGWDEDHDRWGLVVGKGKREPDPVHRKVGKPG